MDCGVSEADFWDMTVGEMERAILSARRRRKLNLKQQALMDYTQAILIGVCFSRAMSDRKSKVPIPELEDTYAFLFQEEIEKKAIEEKKQRMKDEASAAMFIRFADSINRKFINDATKEVSNE